MRHESLPATYVYHCPLCGISQVTLLPYRQMWIWCPNSVEAVTSLGSGEYVCGERLSFIPVARGILSNPEVLLNPYE